MLKKTLALALACTMILTLAACGTPAAPAASSAAPAGSTPASQGGASAEQVTINFFHRWPMEPRYTYFNELIAEFEAQNPNIKVKMDSVENDAYKEKIRVLVANQDIPDIFCTWSDTFAFNLVKSGKIKELNYLVDGDKAWSSQIMQSQFSNFTQDGKIYGIPLTIDGKMFVYNKDAFAKKGLSEPKTYTELIAVLDALKDDYKGAPLIEGLANAWAISHYLGTLFQRIVDPAVLATDYVDATAAYTDPGYLEALNKFSELTAYMGKNATSITHTDARNAFIAGEHAIIYCQIAELKNFTDANMNIGYFNFPAIEGGKGDPEQLTGAPEGFMLSNVATGAKAEAAEKLLKFITEKTSAEKFVKDCGSPVAINGAMTPDNSTDEMRGAVELIYNAKGSWPWFDNAVSIGIADAFMVGCQAVAAGDKTNDAVMKDVQAAAAKVK